MNELKYASVGKRIGATLLDGIFVSIIALLVASIFGMNKNHSDIFEQILRIVYVLFLPLFWYGYTLGKRIVSVKMVKKDGRRIGFLNMFLRTVANIGYLVPIGVGLVDSFGRNVYAYEDKMWSILETGVIPSSFIIGTLISMGLLLASIIMMSYRNDRRTLHDLVAGTSVVEKEGKKQP